MNSGIQVLVAGYRFRVAGYKLLVAGSRPMGYPLLVLLAIILATLHSTAVFHAVLGDILDAACLKKHLIEKRNCKEAQQKPTDHSFDNTEVPSHPNSWDITKSKRNESIDAEYYRVEKTEQKTTGHLEEGFDVTVFILVYEDLIIFKQLPLCCFIPFRWKEKIENSKDNDNVK